MALMIVTVIALAVLAAAAIGWRGMVHRRHALADQRETEARARRHSLH